ncbi:MAG: hypothetical protein JW973_12300 [Bacteroidales bacterium]|nr:hypothetical protein [Bacteroidales bacterium]
MRNVLIIFILSLLNLSSIFSSSKRDVGYVLDSIEFTQYIDSARTIFQFNYEAANGIALEGLSKFENTRYVIGKIYLLQLLAEIHYYYKNNYDSSFFYLNRMKQLADSIGLPRGTAWYFLNLANVYYYQDIYYEQGELNKAMEFYLKAKKEAEKIGDTVIIADALAGIADILMQQEDYKNSLLILYQALDYSYSTGRLRTQFLLYDDIANIYKLTDQYDSSYYYYLKTLEIAEKLENRFGVMVTNLNLLYVTYKINPAFNVLPKLKAIMEESRRNNFMRLYLDAGYTICEILQDKNEFEEAYLLYQQVTNTRDSIFGTDMVRKVAEYESAYKLIKSQLENKQLMSQNEIASLKLRNRQIVLFLVVFILIQAVIMLVIIYRKYRVVNRNIQTIKLQERKIFEQEKELIKKQKEAIEQKLSHKEKEQTIKVMKIFHHNQLIQKVVGELERLKAYFSKDGDKKESIRSLQNLINEMNYSLNNQIWKEFETIFVESNPRFLETLHEKYPSLTSNEIKLCVFLFLNMRTKDIASITQQSAKSINVARTRLRKKLNLENTNINLSGFLQQIS